MNKEKKIDKFNSGLHKLCRKYKVSYQRDFDFNNDLHLQFRKKFSYSKNSQYSSYGIDYAECYISEKDLEDRPNYLLLRDLKGFLRMSFKAIQNKNPLHLSEDDEKLDQPISDQNENN